MSAGAALPALPSGFIQAITSEFPGDFASVDPLDLATYGRDFTSVFPPRASMLCRPRATEEVSRLMRLCTAHRVRVVPSGGRTGLACGALAAGGELVLSLERMQRMDAIDPLGLTVRVQAGTVLEAVQRYCAMAELFWPIELECVGAQVGGIIATNASGMHVLEYGLAGRWVLGMTVVLASGDVLPINGALEKNSAGLNLRDLFIGSEGILGVITEATLKLTHVPPDLDVLLLAVPSFGAVLQVFEQARRASFTLRACEAFTDRCLTHVLRYDQRQAPFDMPSPHYLLLEINARGDSHIVAWLQSLREREFISGAKVAQNRQEAADIWRLRFGIDQSVGTAGLVRGHNVSVPVSRLRTFYSELEALFANDGFSNLQLCLYCHVGEGTLHFRIIKPEAMEKRVFLACNRSLEKEIFELVRSHQGSVSAEHGVGLIRKGGMVYTRSAAESEAMRAIKRALDPNDILNPGKVL